MDVGKYHADAEWFKQQIEEMQRNYPGISLPSQYDYFFQDNLLRLFIRLARYKFVARLLKGSDRLLEVGCGSGVGAMFLSQHCEHVTGLDVNFEIEEARQISRRRNTEFILQDLFTYKPESQFDVAVCLDVIEHMPVEEGHKLVEAMVKLLKPTGMLVVGSPSIHSYPYQSDLSKASHIKCYDLPELLDVIGTYCGRTLPFMMNDEMVHTGHPKMAWYYFILGFVPQL